MWMNVDGWGRDDAEGVGESSRVPPPLKGILKSAWLSFVATKPRTEKSAKLFWTCINYKAVLASYASFSFHHAIMNFEARETLSNLILAITRTGDLYLDPEQVKVGLASLKTGLRNGSDVKRDSPVHRPLLVSICIPHSHFFFLDCSLASKSDL